MLQIHTDWAKAAGMPSAQKNGSVVTRIIFEAKKSIEKKKLVKSFVSIDSFSYKPQTRKKKKIIIVTQKSRALKTLYPPQTIIL